MHPRLPNEVLYIQVLSGMPRTRFSISARSQAILAHVAPGAPPSKQAHAKWLLNGATTQGAVKAGLT